MHPTRTKVFPHVSLAGSVRLFPFTTRDVRFLSPEEIVALANAIRLPGFFWDGLDAQTMLDMVWAAEDFGGYPSWAAFLAADPGLAKHVAFEIAFDAQRRRADVCGPTSLIGWLKRAEWRACDCDFGIVAS